nr:hypothetical protein [Tanacetum cinerariifolium]
MENSIPKKYQHLKEGFENKNSVTSSDAPTFDLVFVIGQLQDQIQSRGNTIRELREKITRLKKKHSDALPIHDLKALDSQNKELHTKVNALHDLNERWQVENEKVERHYQELYDSIKITCAKNIKKTNSLLTEAANLKAQIQENHISNYLTMPTVKSKVLSPGRYAIDIKPIPLRIRNNREVHLDYLKNLNESVETHREIVEEAKVERPLDISFASACLYTRHSHELLEYVIGTCLKDFNQRVKKHAVTTRKKQVTFMDPCKTSTNNTLTHVKQQTMHQTNEHVIPFTGVKGATVASGSKPWSNTKNDRTLPAKSDMQKVEFHLRNNKSSVKQKNHVDSSISYKRNKLLLLLATPKTNPLFTLVITKPHMSCENLGKLKPTADIGIFVCYAPRPAPTFLTPGQIRSGLVPNPVPVSLYVPQTNKDIEILFQLMFDEYLEPPRVERLVSPAITVPVPVNTVKPA